MILRPGTVFGPGKKDLSGRVGIDTFGVFIQVGGSNLLPLTFVDNCADAIVLAGLKPGVDGEVFNVVDDDLLTSSQFLRAYQKSREAIPFDPSSVRRRLWVVPALGRILEAIQGPAPACLQQTPLRCRVEKKPILQSEAPREAGLAPAH